LTSTADASAGVSQPEFDSDFGTSGLIEARSLLPSRRVGFPSPPTSATFMSLEATVSRHVCTSLESDDWNVCFSISRNVVNGESRQLQT
jgi:hypothetical protein